MIGRYAVRVLKVFAWVIGSVIGVIVIAAVVLYVLASVDREDAFYIRDATFAEDPALAHAPPNITPKSGEEYERYIAIPFAAHHLKSGKGVMFGYRFFSNGSVMIDDEDYKKLTFWVNADIPTAGAVINLQDDKKIIALFTKGGSAWPRNACFGYIESGSVRLQPSNKEIRVSLSGEFVPTRGNNVEWCRREKVTVEFDAKEIQLDTLTPWLGAPGHHIYDETYRR